MSFWARGLKERLKIMGLALYFLTMRILLVEDERKLSRIIKRYLEEEGYEVEEAFNGEDALFLLREKQYDLVILDLMLPKMDGLEVLKGFRQERGGLTPVLILTAKDTVEDVVKGLDAGADDYLTKPFAFEELLARVRALLRRKKEELELRVDDLVLDLLGRRVFRGSKEIELTSKEFAVLECLMRRVGEILTREEIGSYVWGEEYDSTTNIVDVYINHLRRKIDQDFPKKLIHTVRGMGYMLKG